MGVARDNYPQGGQPFSSSPVPKSKWMSKPAAHRCSTTLAVADVGTVLHPNSLGGQIRALDAWHRARHRAEVVRQTLRRAAREAFLPELAANHPRCAAEDGVARDEHS